jgi:uncharacterized membrane protein
VISSILPLNEDFCRECFTESSDEEEEEQTPSSPRKEEKQEKKRFYIRQNNSRLFLSINNVLRTTKTNSVLPGQQ